MTSRSTVESRDRLRLFLALPLPSETREQLTDWQNSQLQAASEARIVPPANLHVTLAFLGSRPVDDVEAIVAAMRASAAETQQLSLAAERYRETRSVGMVVFEDVGGCATQLAERLSGRLESLGVYEPERRPWLPHVTVLRFRRRPGLSPGVPDVGRFSPSEVALYHSVLRPTGAQYEIRESVALGG